MEGSFGALYIAYSIVWLGVFAYLAYMYLRQHSIDKDIKSLKEEVAKHVK
jgi:CcmD family protein